MKAVREIRADLSKSGVFIGSAIELIDESVLEGRLSTSPILSTDLGIIDGWNKVLPEFLTMIEHDRW